MQVTGVTNWPLRVLLHGHRDVQVNQPVDVTQFVSRVTASHGVTPPWDTTEVTLQLPREYFELVMPGARRADGVHGVFQRRMAPGGWVVVALEDYATSLSPVAIAFGYIRDISFGVQVLRGIGGDGPMGTAPVTLFCDSWLTAAGNSNIRVAANSNTAEAGFVYQFDDWMKVVEGVLRNANNSSLGSALEQLWASTSMMVPPDTLLQTPAPFGDQVKVVYDRTTAQTWASARAGEMSPVSGLYLMNMPKMMPDATLTQWLFSAFVPSTDVVECFPSLEYPPTFTDKNGDSRPPAAVEAPVGAGSNMTPISAADPRSGTETSAGAEGSSNLTALGAALGGAQPVIVYRHKPFQLRPINKVAAAEYGYHTEGPANPTDAEKLGLYQQALVPTPSSGVHPVSRRYTLLRDEVTAIVSATLSDTKRVNLVYAKNFFLHGEDSAARMYDHLGNAVLPSKSDLQRYGLRAFEPTWPYVLTPAMAQEVDRKMSGGHSADVLGQLSALNELFYSIVGDGESYADMTVTTLCRPRMRAGHWFKMELPVAKVDDSGMQHATGYIERLQHVFQRNGNNWETSTTIQASRCTFSSVENDYRTPVAASTATAQAYQSQQQGKSSQQSNNPSSEFVIYDVSGWTNLYDQYFQKKSSVKLNVPTKGTGQIATTASEVAAAAVDLHPKVNPVVAFRSAQQGSVAVVVKGRIGAAFSSWSGGIAAGERRVAIDKATQEGWTAIEEVRIYPPSVGTFLGPAQLFFVQKTSPWTTITRSGSTPVKTVVVHHTDTANAEGMLQGWGARGCGAHYAVGTDGTTYMFANPQTHKSDHAVTSKQDAGKTGLSPYVANISAAFDLIGRMQTQLPAPKQVESAKKLTAFLCTQFGIAGIALASPQQLRVSGASSTTADVLSVADIVAQKIALLGHSRVFPTQCPGKNTDVPALLGTASSSPSMRVVTDANVATSYPWILKVFPKAAKVLAVADAPVGTF